MKQRSEISQEVDSWIAEQELPTRANLKVVRGFDPFKGWSDEDVEAWFDYIGWYLSQEFKEILAIETPKMGEHIWVQYEEVDGKMVDVSAFNTHDFARQHPQKFSGYNYRLRKIYGRVEELALRYSVITDTERRCDVRARFEGLVRCEFKDRLEYLELRFMYGWRVPNMGRLLSSIGELKARVKECEDIWAEISSQV